jgi:lipopolysaccharide export system permease protein
MKLHLYFARRFLVLLVGVLAAFGLMLLLIDLIEQIRRFGDEGVGFGQILTLTALSLPATLYQILPLIVILATLSLFLGLARSSELVVTRAAGRSALRAVTAPAIVAFLFGVFSVAALNPIVTATTARYEVLSDRFQGRVASVLSISDEGLWLREGSASGQTVISAASSNPDGTVLRDVSFLGFDLDGTPAWRIEAASAQLGAGRWDLTDGKRWEFDAANPERAAQAFDAFSLPSSLTREQIRTSSGTASTIPVWALPGYIDRLERAGFAARSHRVWLHMELANPFFFAAMVLVAAAFTLRHVRFGRHGLMILFALLSSFSLYFVRNFAQILGENGQIPVLLAAWAPPVATLLLPAGLLLHLEDG